jgi:enterochelin esterase family protein
LPEPFPNLPPDRRGRVQTLRHTSHCLAGNPWHDPAERDLIVYTPAGYQPSWRYPAVLILPAYAGTGEGLLARGLSDVSLATRMDRLIADGCPPFVAVLPDAMTSVGGSQYLDSEGIGAYQTWIAEEIPQFVADQVSLTGRWGAVGRSSGGYGALMLAMRRPGVVHAVASHAGDMGFDLSYLPEIRDAVFGTQQLGGLDGLVKRFWEQRRPGPAAFAALNMLAMACAYDPAPGRHPYPCNLPFDPNTGEVDLIAFARWRHSDPLYVVDEPGAADALRDLDLLWLDAGERDEYGLQLGLRRFIAKLDGHGVSYEYEEHEGGHRSTSWRYDESLPRIVRALEEPG